MTSRIDTCPACGIPARITEGPEGLRYAPAVELQPLPDSETGYYVLAVPDGQVDASEVLAAGAFVKAAGGRGLFVLRDQHTLTALSRGTAQKLLPHVMRALGVPVGGQG